jgi:hypothetical protein
MRTQKSMSLVRLQPGRTYVVLNHAHVCEGSVVRRTLLGLTANHARRRAERWVLASSTDPRWLEC